MKADMKAMGYSGLDPRVRNNESRVHEKNPVFLPENV